MNQIIKDTINKVNKIRADITNLIRQRRLRWQLTRGRKSEYLSTEDITTFTNSNAVITEMKMGTDLSKVIIVVKTSENKYQFLTERKSKSVIPIIESILEFERLGVKISGVK